MRKLITCFAITSVLMVLVSCAEEYPVVWNLHTDMEPSDISIEMVFVSPGTHRSTKFTVIPGQTESIRVPEGFVHLALNWTHGVQLYSYPRLSHIEPGHPIEIFVYSIEVEEIQPSRVVLESKPSVSAYFAEFFEKGRTLTVYSTNRIVEMAEPLPTVRLEDVVGALQEHGESEHAQYAYEILDDWRNVETGVNYGYVVQSNVDGSYHWLERGFF